MRWSFLVAVLATCVAAPPAMACSAQAETLVEAADHVSRKYVIEEEARRIARELRDMAIELRAARRCKEANSFASLVDSNLEQHDPHFRFEVTDKSNPDMQQSTAQWLAQMEAENAGIREVRMLDQRIAYIRISSFYGAADMRAKLDASFTLLTGAEALILDLRRNRGGDGEGAGLLAGKLLDPDAKPVVALETRTGRQLEPAAAHDPLRFDTSKPLVILIDRRTASAAEWLAFSAQASGRARIVGDRSFGAAHMIGDPIILKNGFSISIPDARPVSLATGRSWERVGVSPDILGGDDPLYTAMRILDRTAR